MNGKVLSAISVVVAAIMPVHAQIPRGIPEAIEVTEELDIIYHSYPNGDRVPDFSYCGYMASEEEIPDLLTSSDVSVVKVSPSGGDDTQRIQDAIDHVGSLPVLFSGFRGVVLLSPGQFRLDGELVIRHSGVVVRGAGCGHDGTTLFAAGTSRETVFTILGRNDRKEGEAKPMRNEYVPVNSTLIPLPEGHGFKVDDRVIVTRPTTPEWIRLLKADNLGMSADYQLWVWTPGDYDVRFDRTVTSVDETSITVDVPMPISFDPEYGSGYVAAYSWEGRIDHVGIENLELVSEYDPDHPKDEDHRWMAITFDNARDCWARRIITRHFVSSLAAIWNDASRITVEDCKCLEPVGEIGGFRRMAFQTFGQQTLFQRCWSEKGYHDFSVGENTAGPNAFVQCWATDSHSYSGATGGWSCGTLFDRCSIDNAPLMFTNMYLESMGGSWATTNSLCWICRTPQLWLQDPPLSHNWAFGTKGQSYGDGSHGEHRISKPESLYHVQLEARLGRKSPDADKVIRYPHIFGFQDPRKLVYPEESILEAKRSTRPATTMDVWIDSMIVKDPLVTTVNRGIDVGSLSITHPQKPVELHPIAITNGRLTIDGEYAAGSTARTSMWRGMLRRSTVQTASDNINRFVPGRTGIGYTDCLDTVVSHLKSKGRIGLYHFPALWYERRRDDHGRMMRANPDVWAPFLEQPFARSGQGEAYDRLSKYDLRRWNAWYWNRIDQFASLADQNGLFLVSEHYLQHNIIEEGAHWADYPWRSANNINDIGFPEQTYYQGDTRVFMAEQFYDVEHNPKLAEYHRLYIRKQLDAVKNRSNVIHHLGIEFTGPLHFMRFWLDCIREWEAENGKDLYVMLSATKDVQDAILLDPRYRTLVDIIDIRQWSYNQDGSIFEPRGGVNLAPRQYSRIDTTAQSGPDAIGRQVRDYRTAYPDIAVVSNAGRVKGGNWIAFVSGGSMCDIPKITIPSFLKDVLMMKPLDSLTVEGIQWGMGDPTVGYVIYTTETEVKLGPAANRKSYRIRWIDPTTGKIIRKPLEGGAVAYITK